MSQDSQNWQQPPKKKSRLWIVLLCVTVVLLVGCSGGSSTGQSSATAPATATATPTVPTATPKPAHFGQSALQILQGLVARGLPIGDRFNYTADNDVNKLLGRPGQYIGKVNFKDTRIASTNQGASISVSDGGSIEVFAMTTDAQHRFAYIQAISTSGNALFAEYEYLDGTVIVRISSQLTAVQASKYQTALKALP